MNRLTFYITKYLIENPLNIKETFTKQEIDFVKGFGIYGLYIFISLLISSYISNPSLNVCINACVILILGGLLYKPEKIKNTTTEPILYIIIISTFLYVINCYSLTNFSNVGLEEYNNNLNSLTPIVMYFSIFIFAPVTEELIFRGLIFKYLKQSVGVFLGAATSTLLFLAVHGTVAHIIPTIVFGLFSCMLLEYTNNIFYCMIVHCTYNICIFFLCYINIVPNNIIFIISCILCISILCWVYLNWVLKTKNQIIYIENL